MIVKSSQQSAPSSTPKTAAVSGPAASEITQTELPRTPEMEAFVEGSRKILADGTITFAPKSSAHEYDTFRHLVGSAAYSLNSEGHLQVFFDKLDRLITGVSVNGASSYGTRTADDLRFDIETIKKNALVGLHARQRLDSLF